MAGQGPARHRPDGHRQDRRLRPADPASAVDGHPHPPERNTCRCLVLSPTRELASQIAESFRTYGQHLGYSVATVFGGVSIRPQIDRLMRGVDILVATPGRLIDHLDQRTLRLDKVEIFVLDEADQMLDMGFIHAIGASCPLLPKERQSLFFSATMPKARSGRSPATCLRDPDQGLGGARRHHRRAHRAEGDVRRDPPQARGCSPI